MIVTALEDKVVEGFVVGDIDMTLVGEDVSRLVQLQGGTPKAGVT